MVKRLITNAPGYYITSDGDLYSYWTKGSNAHINLTKKANKLNKRNRTGNSYLTVSIKINNIHKTKDLHVLVCTIFNGNKPTPKHEVSHLDGNKYNNKSTNLIWETKKENHARKKLHGTDDRGFRNSRAKLNEQQYNEIKNLLNEKNLTHKQIGELYNVNRVFITKINRGYRYNYV